jgi:hypothetical protein
MQTKAVPVTTLPVNPYYAAAEKAVGLEQPAVTGKKPTKQVSSFHAGTGSSRALMIEGWMCADKGPGTRLDRAHARRSRRG